jgi:hypothetical protein
MTTQAETIFVTPEGDAGQAQLPIPSLSIANLLQQREALMTLFHEAFERLIQAQALAATARLGFPDMFLARDYRDRGRHLLELEHRADIMEQFQQVVDAGGWTTLLNDSGMRSIMCASKRKEVDAQINGKQGNVPAFTRDAIVATFAELHASRVEMFEQGVLECFRRLSWDYKSNLPQQFGKRIVMTSLTSYGSANHRQSDELDDLLRVFHLCDGKLEADHRTGAIRLITDAMQSTSEWPKRAENEYVSLRLFKNHNGHVTFKRPDLVQRLNRILAQHDPHALAAPR